MQETIKNIIQDLENDILDRRGLKWEWHSIDPDIIENEIKPAWAKIIEKHLTKLNQPDDGSEARG